MNRGGLFRYVNEIVLIQNLLKGPIGVHHVEIKPTNSPIMNHTMNL